MCTLVLQTNLLQRTHPEERSKLYVFRQRELKQTKANEKISSNLVLFN